jgi:hypothetical protein
MLLPLLRRLISRIGSTGKPTGEEDLVLVRGLPSLKIDRNPKMAAKVQFVKDPFSKTVHLKFLELERPIPISPMPISTLANSPTSANWLTDWLTFPISSDALKAEGLGEDAVWSILSGYSALHLSQCSTGFQLHVLESILKHSGGRAVVYPRTVASSSVFIPAGIDSLEELELRLDLVDGSCQES